MATNKTLNPTGVTIAIPAMADKPDASVFSNCIDKEADAINTLNRNFGDCTIAKASVNAGEFTINISVDSGKRVWLIFGASNVTPFMAVVTINSAHTIAYITEPSLTVTIQDTTHIKISGFGSYSNVVVISSDKGMTLTGS